MSRDAWSKKRAKASDDNGWQERGGYMAAKKSKLEEQFKLDAPKEKQKEGTCSKIFSGVSIYVNGYTDPSADELRRIMMLHGGQFHVYYSRFKTTHIIANNLPNSKIQDLKEQKVIRPDWITDSVKAGRLLPWLEYQLYAKHKGPLFRGVKVQEQSSSSHQNSSVPKQGSPHNHVADQQVASERRQSAHLQTQLPSHSEPVKPTHKPQLSALTTPHSSLQQQKKDQPEPRSSVSCISPQGSCSEKLNGLFPTSTMDSAVNNMQECRTDASPPLTNGHAPHVNGALNSEDLSPVESTTMQVSNIKPDPYEFPSSPPKPSPVCQEPGSQEEVTEAIKATEGQTPSQLHTSSLSPAFHSRPPIRINGSHHNALSSYPVSVAEVAVKPHPPTDRMPSSEAQLLAQTGGLISEFYSHSRLHQISTWRTGFSEYVNELHSKRKSTSSTSFPGKEKLRKLMAQRSTGSQGAPAVKSCIFHVDMDCFFVSVGIRHRPDLKGKPVAVTSNRGQTKVPARPGTDPQLERQLFQKKFPPAQPDEDDLDHSGDAPANGVDTEATLSMAEIASCSYEARQAGVRNGMFFGKAKQLCPTLQSVPYDFDAYKEVALTMYETLAGYTHDIEALSCDEVLIDTTALLGELVISPEDLARAIRADIKEKTGCCASVGMGSNILLARLSTRKAKPDGQYFLKSEEVDDFIRDLSVTSLPGVGPVMGRKLAAFGVRTCGDLQQVSLSQLQKKFGPRTGQTLFRFCRGLDDRPVRYEKERKSVSAEMNYNIRFKKVDETECFLSNLSMEVQKRLQDAGLRGRRVTLKVMVRKEGAPVEPSKYGGHGICDHLAKTVMLAQSTDSGQLIAAAVIKLFHTMKLRVEDLRGIGIQVQLLEGNQRVCHNANGLRTRSIKDLLLGPSNRDTASRQEKSSPVTPSSSSLHHPGPEPQPGTSREKNQCVQTPKQSRKHLNFSIEVPSPSQVDRSVLDALPAELREQVEQSWTFRDVRPNHHHLPSLQEQRPPSPPKSRPPSPPPASGPARTLVLQFPNQPDNPGLVLQLPNFSQVDPEVFAALPKELQEELKSAYSHVTNNQPQVKTCAAEPKNPLLQLKQSVGRVKRRYKRKNVSPAKRNPSPLKKHSPKKTLPPLKPREPVNTIKTENAASTSSAEQEEPESVAKFNPLPAPALAGASDLADIKTLLREWVTTIADPMEEDILQVVKYCTDLVEYKDLEQLDLIVKYMKRLMQQSVESVWSMAFDFILDNVQVVLQQVYGSTLKLT
ncbi:DNA repair protein REV1 [Synchiropus splendidus]|uniref:DNA repair protein REV1 n=1 Tax=Synchiropus splendidus TaxID=270530 RepID=UPI00237E09AD|nr:DNA repair protein REV1 [Synchiropus splendidus]